MSWEVAEKLEKNCGNVEKEDGRSIKKISWEELVLSKPEMGLRSVDKNAYKLKKNGEEL